MGTSQEIATVPIRAKKGPCGGGIGLSGLDDASSKRLLMGTNNLRGITAIVGLMMTLNACEFNAPVRDSRRDSISWPTSGSDRSVEVTVTKMSGAVASAKIEANSPFVQVLSVEGSSPMSGTVLSFPPGTLMVPTEVRVEEGASVAVPSVQAAVGLAGNVAQQGTPVAVSSSVATDPVAPFSIALSLPDVAALRETALSFAALYKIVRHKDGSIIAGVIPTSAIAIKDGKAHFEAPFFGIYQVVLTKSPVMEAKSIPVTTPIQTKAEVANLAPMQVSGRSSLVVTAGQTVELRGKNFRPTMQLALGDTMIRGVNVVSDVSASFIAPTLMSFGLKDLSVDQDGVSQTVSLVYQGGASDFPVITLPPAEVCAGQKFYDARGQVQSGTKACYAQPPPAACTQDGAVGCVTTKEYPAVGITGLASKVLAGATVAGIVGTVSPEVHSACAADGATGCVAVASFKAVSMSKLTASVIKDGTTIAGVSGTYGPTCASDGQVNCVVSSTSPFKAANVSGINSWDIRSGKALAGLHGSLSFYRNLANSNVYNRNTGKDASAGLDIYDTIDDYNNNNSTSPFIPLANPWGAASTAPGSNWTDMKLGPCNGSGDCVLKDETTALLWAKSDQTKRTWEEAISYCAALNKGGLTGWRVPTQKELLQAYVDGIWSKKDALNFTTSDQYWSSTTISSATWDSWTVALNSGEVKPMLKGGTEYALCTK